MSDKKTIFILQKAQFGYHTATYKFCLYLKKEYHITYICIDSGKPKVEMEGVQVVYSPNANTFLGRGFAYLSLCKKRIKSEQPFAVFAVYFPSVSLLVNKSPTKMILDVRSGKISPSPFKRFFFDTLLRFESFRFKHLAVISESLRKRLKLNQKKAQILPIAADILSESEKKWDELNLLYVGALNFRNIQQTIEGCAIFAKRNPDLNWKYNIVAYGAAEVEVSIKKRITELNLQNNICFHGRKMHEAIWDLWDSCNVGVAYIPKTSYFDCQPPTKTYEYLQAGMVCLATDTAEHRLLINAQNGVIHNDNPKDFANALETFYRNKDRYHSNSIRNSMEQHTWKKIVATYLIPLLEE